MAVAILASEGLALVTVSRQLRRDLSIDRLPSQFPLFFWLLSEQKALILRKTTETSRIKDDAEVGPAVEKK